MQILKKMCATAALGLACLGLASAGGAAENGDHAADAKQETARKKAETFRVRKAPVQVTIPPGEWKKMTPEDMQRDSPLGCLPAAGTPPGLFLTIHRTDSRITGSLTRLPQKYLMRNEQDLRSFIKDVKETVEEQGGEVAEMVSSELSRRDDLYVHRMEFLVRPESTGGCGRTASKKGAPPRMRYVLWDYFVRPADGEARLYRLGIGAPEDSFEKHADMMETFGTSFTFTGRRADSFFEPDAPSEKLPQVNGGEGECGAFQSPALLVFGAVILVLWWWSRRRRQEDDEEETTGEEAAEQGAAEAGGIEGAGGETDETQPPKQDE